MSTDLLHSEDRKSLGRDAYQAVGSTHGAVACRLYTDDQLAVVPASARDIALGVGNHMVFADIRPGDVVLDIGCGGGIDTVLAAHATGRDGKVYALDSLPEMLDRTQKAAEEAGWTPSSSPSRARWRPSRCPTAASTSSSPTAINLSPRKSRVFAECARVLRGGGRFCVSDITIVEEQLPPEVLVHPAAWAG